MIGAVIDAPTSGGLAASGLAELSLKIPSPTRPTGPHAYLSSVSTDPRWRRQSMARATISFILEELQRRGVRRVELHATADGFPLYRSFGFVERLGGQEMRLEL